ncbi:hypothetical protein DL122_08435 [Salmonella enterica subsp. salamae]|nr:hypothetical protein [Salmonella enterica]EBX1905177.1 hypothetical protein [Salmonella enterica subsp. enterica serovar Zaiman]EBZ6205504.1 hypothetical protein [Salmonella enterica subsp. enterica serovar Napoli]ECD4873537.1 hypothetical protein [Salmonella enterica subsp. enterica serovar Schwarzengrund]ECD5690642.1 hypothetical protein [Salmonella enterica subsp. enterica serovar Give]ECG0705714.1 hypothetical protein [Salmonella enterica subsp. salamae]ECP8283699.1 hypothetical protei
MNNVAKTELVFHETKFTVTRRNGQIWFTANDLAHALQYAHAKSITNLYNQNFDEFSQGMSQVIESVTSGNYRKRVRIFSLRGAHLLAMFARTPIAKEFRRWVLDILDRETVRKRGSAKERVAVLCPCCGKPATVIGTNTLTRHRAEIIAECGRLGCPSQQFKSEIYFSHYVEQIAINQSFGGIIQALSPVQKQRLIYLLSTYA